MQTEQLKVTGMTCGTCTSSVARALKAVAGVGDVVVSLADSEATVQYDERVTSPERLRSAVRVSGYGVDATDSGQSRTQGWLLRLMGSQRSAMRPRRQRSGCGSRAREAKYERDAPFTTGSLQGPTLQLHDGVYDGESQTIAFGPARTRLVAPREAGEQTLELGLRNLGPWVRERYSGARRTGRYRDVDAGRFRRVANRVRKQVRDRAPRE